MRLKGLLVVMTTPSEERRRHLQFVITSSCSGICSRKNLLLAHQLDRVKVDYVSVLGTHLGDDLVGIALRLPSLALEIQHLGVKDLGIPFPHYFQF
jgi:hypothetical protein